MNDDKGKKNEGKNRQTLLEMIYECTSKRLNMSISLYIKSFTEYKKIKGKSKKKKRH